MGQENAVRIDAEWGVITIAGVDEPVALRYHVNARRFTLKVSQTRRAVALTMPPDASPEAARRFVAGHVDWIIKQIGALPEPVPFVDGAVVPFRGVSHLLRFTGAGRRGCVVKREGACTEGQDVGVGAGGDADVALPSLCVSGEERHAPRRLFDWLVRQACDDIGKRVRHHADTLDLHPRRIHVRDQTSRWGSCSSRGTLSFSWRLILAPALVLDYVVAHEVAHLAEMNHSPRFWALVQSTLPRMQEARRWLKLNGARLHCYGIER